MIKHSDWLLLCRLYECNSITKASAALYMTQPALTKRLQQIEEEFGMVIAHRNAKGLVFTPKGEYLVKYAQRMLQEYAELEQLMSGKTDAIFGTLHIASCRSLAHFLLPSLLSEYKQRYPAIEFDVSTDFSYKVIQAVRARRVQIGFVRGEYVDGVEKVRIRTQQAYAVSAQPISLDDLPNLPRIDFSSDPKTTAKIDAWWYERYKVPPRIGMVVSSGTTCYEMVRHGLGYAIFLNRDFFDKDPNIHAIPLYDRQNKPLIRNDLMIYKKETLQNELTCSFVNFAEEYYRKNFQK